MTGVTGPPPPAILERAIYVDNNSTPIGTATASNGTADVQTTVQLPDGLHTFTTKESVSIRRHEVGNRTIAAGDLYSDRFQEHRSDHGRSVAHAQPAHLGHGALMPRAPNRSR